MTKKIISKCGRRHRPAIDMMEFMQTTEAQEFDLDKELFDDKPLTMDDIDSLLSISDEPKKVKKNQQKNTRHEPTVITDVVDLDIEHNGEFAEIIENQE